MGFLNRVADFLAAEPRAQRAMLEQRPVAGSSIVPRTAGKPQWLPREVSTYDRDAYRKIALIFRCVQYVADAAATAPLKVYQTIDGELQPFDAHPLRDLLMRPNAGMGEARFMSFITMVMSVSGFVLIEKERDLFGNVIGLWPLRSDWTRPIPRTNAPPDWEYRIPGEQYPRILKSVDVIPVTYADTPDGSYTGIGPLELLLRETSTVNALTDFLKVFMDRGAMPLYVAIPSDDPQLAAQFRKPEAKQAFIEAWRQRYGGLRNANEPMILGAIKDIKQLGFNFNELAYTDLHNLNDSRICTAFGIPPILMGTQVGLEHATYSNYGEARRSFYEDTMTPLWARLDDAFSRELINDRDFASDISMQFDTSDIPALQDDQDAASVRAVAQFTAGLISRHPAQRIAGHEPHGADVFLIPFSVVEVPVDGVKLLPKPTAQISDSVDDEQDDERARRLRVEPGVYILGVGSPIEPRLVTRDGCTYMNPTILSSEQRARQDRVVAQQKATIGKLADVLEPKLDTYFEGQKERIIESVAGSRSDNGWQWATEGALKELTSHRAIESFDWQAEANELRTILEQWMATVEEQAMAQTAAMIGGDFAWNVSNPLLASLVNSLGYRIRVITEETRASVETVIRESLLEGTTTPDLAGKLEDLFDQTYNGRAMTVARTESMVGYGRASALAFQRSGVVSQVMVADNSEHTESYRGAADGLSCSERNGLVVSVDRGPYHVESDHPNRTGGGGGRARAERTSAGLPIPRAALRRTR
jgi:HK97 family phage portal protein